MQYREELESDREGLLIVLRDLESRKIILEDGHDEFIENLKRRIASIDDKLTRAD